MDFFSFYFSTKIRKATMIASALMPHIHKIRYLLDDHSTTILTAAAVSGTVVTAVLTGRATFKAAALIEQEKGNILDELIEHGHDHPGQLGETDLPLVNKVKLVWVQYLPPAAAGVMTITCMIAANKISSKKIAALAVAGGISERALQEYKEKVIEKLGVRQDEKIRDAVAQDMVDKNPVSNQVIIAGSGDVLCFEPLTGRYFTSTVEDVKRAENKVNYEIIHFDSCSLSIFFEEVGLTPTDYSDQVGWNVNHRMETKFTTTMSEDKRPCLVVGFTNMPKMDYDKNWT